MHDYNYSYYLFNMYNCNYLYHIYNHCFMSQLFQKLYDVTMYIFLVK